MRLSSDFCFQQTFLLEAQLVLRAKHVKNNFILRVLDSEEVEEKIIVEELQRNLRKMKYGKSPEHDKITVELFITVGAKGIQILLEIITHGLRKNNKWVLYYHIYKELILYE